jgi:hypothetical protein
MSTNYSPNKIDFFRKTLILSQVFENRNEDNGWDTFAEYNDVGLPLAYASYNELAVLNEDGKKYVEETYDLLLKGLDLITEEEKEVDYVDLQDVINAWEAKNHEKVKD